jgi:hypothetical protein
MAKSVFKKITEWIMEAAEKPPKNLPETPEPYEDDPDNPIKQKLDGLLAKAEQVDEATDPIDWVVRVVEWRSELLALATALYKVPTGDPDTQSRRGQMGARRKCHPGAAEESAELTTALGAVGIIQIEPDPIHEGQTRHIFDYDKLFSLIADPASTFAAPDRPSAIAYDPTGTRLVQSSADYHIRIWDLGGSTSDPIKDLRGHPGRINDVAFSPDGRHIASAADDHTARIWDADPAGPNDQLHVLDKHFLSVWSAWNHDGTKLRERQLRSDRAHLNVERRRGAPAGRPRGQGVLGRVQSGRQPHRQRQRGPDRARLERERRRPGAAGAARPCRPGLVGRLQPRRHPDRELGRGRHGAHLERDHGRAGAGLRRPYRAGLLGRVQP